MTRRTRGSLRLQKAFELSSITAVIRTAIILFEVVARDEIKLHSTKTDTRGLALIEALKVFKVGG